MSALAPADDGARSLAEAGAAHYDGNKPQSQIEQDIARTRDHLGATLDALERRFAPRRLIEQSAQSLLDSLEGDADQLLARLRENALPLLLIAAGLVWLLLPRRQLREGYALEAPADIGGAPVPPLGPKDEAPEPLATAVDRATAGKSLRAPMRLPRPHAGS
jgi:uncharacterized protein DUF3618